MHLLAAQPGQIQDGSEAVDLGQSAGDIAVLSAADTELALLADARAELGEAFPSLRLANLLHLGHNMSVDLYVEQVAGHAKLIVARLLGGRGYWPYGVDELARTAQRHGIALALLPGDDKPDPELARLSTVSGEAYARLWDYLIHGGPANARSFLGFAASLIGNDADWAEPRPLVKAGLYWPGLRDPGVDDLRDAWKADAPVAALVFYRALVQAGNLAPVDALIEALAGEGVNALPIFCQSLKDPLAAETVEHLLAAAPPAVILNATGFAVSAPGQAKSATPLDQPDCPILQVIFSGSAKETWSDGTHGLSARDIAMNVALPEVDGRVLTRAVSFKGRARRDDATETDVVRYEPVADRVAFVAALAARWAKLRAAPEAERRIALVLANYPNRDGRLGNGVGLDTPAGVVKALGAMAEAGYRIVDVPADGDALVARMKLGPTNDVAALASRTVDEWLPLPDYHHFFNALPEAVRDAVTERWGPPEEDPFFRPGELDCGGFAIPAFRCGNAAVCLQPARGYNLDPVATYHDPALVPPHAYLAFYAWVREGFRADAVVHFGKHGNLEWLPGKALALSEACFPEAALGPLPHLYPFIVNDPGEGTQAKRRAAAVIVDHLTPPLARAETYGPLKDLEQLVDEYYEAAGVDPRRLKVLREDILTLAQATGLAEDVGIETGEEDDTALAKLDNYLCELKEMQIRDGLHVFGESPTGGLAESLLTALVRVPRGKGDGGDASLQRAIADDLGLGFDPLDCEMAAPWDGPTPDVLAARGDGPWRTAGDTVERIEALALDLIAGRIEVDAGWARSRAVLDGMDAIIRPAIEACGEAELQGLLSGLAGRFVAPGPSGAPTRGRPEVLPTGRNFYSVDTRVVPTPAAWRLGWKSAALLVERYVQDHGEWPQAVALSAWGTSNMRTGGDDIAQALALIGVEPEWDGASRRLTGFRVLPADVLGRPRVDVTLRISGFFRDAFPGLIDLFDSAVRAVAGLDEPAEQNPIAARARADAAAMTAHGVDAEEAGFRAACRVFGSKPGAYGAGLQALIDERLWETDADLADAYLSWGGYAYGGGRAGEARRELLERRLSTTDAVLHNQDNREHDLLDSDDYYQFEGGLAAAVRNLKGGAQPAIYHNDHSRPETPKVRTLEDEVARVVRARVVNPKWIAGVMRHGYKGAFEMAATVDYLFAFQATARCVKDHHFDAVFEAYLGDDEVRGFVEAHNPDALREMAERLREAQDRGLWTPRRNDTRGLLDELARAGSRPARDAV